MMMCWVVSFVSLCARLFLLFLLFLCLLFLFLGLVLTNKQTNKQSTRETTSSRAHVAVQSRHPVEAAIPVLLQAERTSSHPVHRASLLVDTIIVEEIINQVAEGARTMFFLNIKLRHFDILKYQVSIF